MCSPISDGAATAIVCSRAMVDPIGTGGARRAHPRLRAHGRRSSRPPTGSKITSRASPQIAPMRSPAWGLRMSSLRNVTMRRRSAKSCRAKRSASSPSARAVPPPNVARRESAGACRSIRRAASNRKAHPIGATGLGQIFELVMQLRGEAGARQVGGARVALAENGGGLRGIEEAAIAVTILERA